MKLYIAYTPSIARIFAEKFEYTEKDKYYIVADDLVTWLGPWSLYYDYPSIEISRSIRRPLDAIRHGSTTYVPDNVFHETKYELKQINIVKKLLNREDVTEIIWLSDDDIRNICFIETIREYYGKKDAIYKIYIEKYSTKTFLYNEYGYGKLKDTIDAGTTLETLEKIFEINLSRRVKHYYNEIYKNSYTPRLSMFDMYLLNQFSEKDGEKSNIAWMSVFKGDCLWELSGNSYRIRWFKYSTMSHIEYLEKNGYLEFIYDPYGIAYMTTKGIRINKIIDEFLPAASDYDTNMYWLNKIKEICEGKTSKEAVINEAVKFVENL